MINIANLRIASLIKYIIYCIVSLIIVLILCPEEELTRSALPSRRHLPVMFWHHMEYYRFLYDNRSGCKLPPQRNELDITNFWQHVTDDGKTMVFAAYWDDRADPLVRLLVSSQEAPTKLRCFLWYYGIPDPVIVQATVLDLNVTTIHVVSCLPPRSDNELAAVSLVTADFSCGIARNILAIQGAPNKTKVAATEPRPQGVYQDKVGACVLWWRQGDASTRLIEWISLLEQLEVNRVYVHINHHAHENVLQVMDYFSWRVNPAILDVMPYTSPIPKAGNTSNSTGNTELDEDFAEYFNEKQETDDERLPPAPKIPPLNPGDMLPYNDCVYRALLDGLKWIALLDLDEVIVPLRDLTWSKLVYHETRNSQPDVLAFSRFWFPELLQSFEYTTPEIKTTSTLSWEQLNSIEAMVLTGKLYRVRAVAGVGSGLVRCLRGECTQQTVDSQAARVHLYPYRCGGMSRGVCRALARRAEKDDVIARVWERARQQATYAATQLFLRPHQRQDIDEF